MLSSGETIIVSTFIIIGIVITVFLIATIFYSRFGWFKSLYHEALRWHMPTDKIGFDGCSYKSECKYCGKHILQDGNGDWF